MRTFLFLLLASGLSIALAACKDDVSKISKRCSAKLVTEGSWEDRLLDNPYELCQRGEIITVQTAVYEDIGTYPIKKFDYAKGVYSNNLDRYCSYDHPIVPLGTSNMRIEFEGKGGIETFLLNSYSCVYIGEERESNLENWTHGIIEKESP